VSIRWIWAGAAAAVIVVNLYMVTTGNTVMAPLFHFIIAASAFVFGAGVVIFAGIQQRALDKLKSYGLSDDEIQRFKVGELTEDEMLSLVKARRPSGA